MKTLFYTLVTTFLVSATTFIPKSLPEQQIEHAGQQIDSLIEVVRKDPNLLSLQDDMNLIEQKIEKIEIRLERIKKLHQTNKKTDSLFFDTGINDRINLTQ